MRSAALLLTLPVLLAVTVATAQTDAPSIPADTALTRALQLSSLTGGSTPFHAIMQISGPTIAYAGTIELTWAAADQYKLTLSTPGFSQQRVVDHADVLEEDHGNYLPRWLENLSQALLDLQSMTTSFKGRNAQVPVGESLRACLKRDDRPGGITDQLTWGVLCFAGSEPHIQSILTFNRDVEFTDYKPFAGHPIARTYTTRVLNYQPVVAHLNTLEPALPAPDFFHVAQPTRTADQIHSTFVSTLQEEGMIETAPIIQWPSVREGRTDGYMIVYARTDRTGQVRETAKHNSDQPGLEQFGMEQALRFKFKPLVLDGIPQQMEMPLVLHFSSKIEDPLPNLTDEQTRRQISGCDIPRARRGEIPFRIIVSVNEEGMLTGESYFEANTPGRPHRSSVLNFSLRSCHFAPYRVNGKASYYHGELLLP